MANEAWSHSLSLSNRPPIRKAETATHPRGDLKRPSALSLLAPPETAMRVNVTEGRPPTAFLRYVDHRSRLPGCYTLPQAASLREGHVATLPKRFNLSENRYRIVPESPSRAGTRRLYRALASHCRAKLACA